jgi:hypothetical protein
MLSMLAVSNPALENPENLENLENQGALCAAHSQSS